MSAGRLMPPGGATPPLDGKTPVFVEVGADPSAGAGLDLPPGSIADFGGTYYWHNDTGATAWIPTPWQTGGSGATVASWTVGTTTPRYFAIDPVNGNDAHAGFSDVSAAAAWLVAKKTWAGFIAIVPNVGAGRSFVLLNGAATMAEDLVLTKCMGYDAIHIVGTTDGSDDATDRLKSGAAIAVAGPNGDSSWSALTASTTTDVKVTGGGFPLDTSAAPPVLFRMRFAGNVTGALANVCANIFASTATDVTPGQTLGAAPGNGEHFFVERPGVLYQRVDIAPYACRSLVLRGIATSNTTGTPWNVAASQVVSLVFCEQRGDGTSINLSNIPGGSLTLSPTYVSIAPTVASSAEGVGFRAASQLGVGSTRSVSSNQSGSIVGALHPTFQSSYSRIQNLTGGQGCVNIGTLQFGQIGNGETARSTDPLASFMSTWGAATTSQPGWRVYGGSSIGLDITGCALLIRDGSAVQASNAGDGVRVSGVGNQLVLSAIAGTQPLGGGSAGLDAQAAEDSVIVALSMTVTGDGDCALPGAVVFPWTDLTKTNIVDDAGNNIQGSAGTIVGQCRLVTCRSSDGLLVGSLGRLISNGFTGCTRADDFAAAACDGVAVTTVGQDDPMYIATPASGGTPYVISETVVVGGLAYVGVYTPGVSKANSNTPNAGEFQLAVGRWLEGSADNSHGWIDFNPELVPAFVDVILMDSNVGTGLSFTVPDGLVAMPYAILEGADLVDGNEIGWSFTGGGQVEVFLRKVGAGDDGVWAARYHNGTGTTTLTLRVKVNFR